MDRRDERRAREAVEREREPVEVVVDEIELARSPERMRHVQRLPHATVERVVLGVAVGTDAVELRRRLGIERGEQRHVDTLGLEAGGDEPGHALPRPVVTRRCAPGHRPENGDLHERSDRRSRPIEERDER